MSTPSSALLNEAHLRVELTVIILALVLGPNISHSRDEFERMLSILHNELPDPHQELFHDRFTLFPNLTVELRLKIWRSAFPRERRIITWYDIDLCLHVYFPEIPITLCINRESRLESLKHYRFVKRSNTMQHDHIYIKIHRGVCVLSRNNGENCLQSKECDMTIGDIYCRFFKDYFMYPRSGFFAAVSILVLNLELWPWGYFGARVWFCTFRHLSKIQLGAARFSDIQVLRTTDIADTLKTRVNEFYNRNRKLYKKVPELVIDPKVSK